MPSANSILNMLYQIDKEYTEKQMLNSRNASNSSVRPQTIAPLEEHQNLQSLLPTQLKSTTPSYQQVSSQKRPLSTVQSLPELSNKMLNSCKTTNSPVRPPTPASLVGHQNLQSMLQTQHKSTTPSYQQVSIQKRPLSTVQSLSGTSKKPLKKQPSITPANDGYLYSNYDQHYGSASSRGNSTSTGFDSNQMRRMKLLKNVQPAFTATSESFEQSLQLHKNHHATLQTRSSIVDYQNTQPLMPTLLKPSTPKHHQNPHSLLPALPTSLEPPTPKYQQVPFTKIPFSTVEPMPDISKTTVSQPPYITVNYYERLRNYFQYYDNQGHSTFADYDSSQLHKIKPLKNVQPVSTATTKSFKQSLQLHKNHKTTLQTQSTIVEYLNQQSLFPTFLEPPSSMYQQVPITKMPLSVVESLPDISHGQSNRNNSNTIMLAPSTSNFNMDTTTSSLIASPADIAADHNYSKKPK